MTGYLKSLELDKIVEKAAGYAACPQAAALLQKVSSRRGDLSVWLGDNAGAAGVSAFLSAAKNAEDRCLSLTEPAA